MSWQWGLHSAGRCQRSPTFGAASVSLHMSGSDTGKRGSQGAKEKKDWFFSTHSLPRPKPGCVPPHLGLPTLAPYRVLWGLTYRLARLALYHSPQSPALLPGRLKGSREKSERCIWSPAEGAASNANNDYTWSSPGLAKSPPRQSLSSL